ncbi:hypothetical protein CDO87_03445 [Sagittula sp. P11]|uniref:portal protein n=1 Tax=Sagittula sp. P11 TaxID=2009329 RepID=UPI000C2D2EEE|nr:portal protein [Sagittula sp. P11]AUC52300.1 hypothetical protein CDO87_03445 [Sagittula sp. P11]
MVMPGSDQAKETQQRWQELKTTRAKFEEDWEDMARLIRPQRGGFNLSTASVRDLSKPLNSGPIIAHGHFAAGIYAGITNPATRWGGFTTPDEDLNNWAPMADWMDLCAAKVHRSFSPSMSSFYPQSYQAYADLAVFGNAACYDELDLDKRRFRDVTISIAQVVVDIDEGGFVVEVIRRYMLAPRQAVKAFRGKVPAKVADLAEKGDTTQHAYFRHIVENFDYRPGMFGVKGKRWKSFTVSEVEDTLLSEKGYDEMPFYYPRWDVDSDMPYGIGPGFVALPSARKLNLMDEATLRAAQRAADPVKLAPDREVVPLNGVWRPGSVIYGAVNMQGNPMIRTEDFNGNIGLTLEEKRAALEDVKEAFYYSVMSLAGRTGISDDENRVIEEARLRNWAPHADRIMEEYAARKFERRFRMLWRAGQIPPPPQGTPSGIPMQVSYTSAATMALRASEAQAARTFVGDLTALSQFKPEVLDRLSADDYAEVLHDANTTLPQKLLVPREVAMQARQARAQQEQAAQGMAAASQGSEIAQKLAGAGIPLGEMMGGGAA